MRIEGLAYRYCIRADDTDVVLLQELSPANLDALRRTGASERDTAAARASTRRKQAKRDKR